MDASPPRDWPPVSVIMPVLDEERHLAEAVAGVLAQDYPGELELVLALGPSQDRTGEIAAGLAAADGRVRLVDNPAGRTPDGLNAAIKTVRYGIVVRVAGHGVLSPGYMKVAVDALDRTGPARRTSAASCGLRGVTDFERAVARAMTSPLGIGAARFHIRRGPVCARWRASSSGPANGVVRSSAATPTPRTFGTWPRYEQTPNSPSLVSSSTCPCGRTRQACSAGLRSRWPFTWIRTSCSSTRLSAGDASSRIGRRMRRDL